MSTTIPIQSLSNEYTDFYNRLHSVVNSGVDTDINYQSVFDYLRNTSTTQIPLNLMPVNYGYNVFERNANLAANQNPIPLTLTLAFKSFFKSCITVKNDITYL
jgi:uncharacterized membrane protein